MSGSEQGSTQEPRARPARVLVNDQPVDIRNPNPTVADVLRKAGYHPDRHDVYRLENARDPVGKKISVETVLHLADREEPVYLRCVPKGAKEEQPSIAPALTTQPEEDPRRGLDVKDLQAPPISPMPSPEPPPGPPGL